jgi:hypothetical protein
MQRSALCISDAGCDDLKVWKIYKLLPDATAAGEQFLRVVDESGEDYLYPASRFVIDHQRHPHEGTGYHSDAN